METLPQRLALRRSAVGVLICGSVLLCFALARNPKLAAMLPKCPVHEYLGLLCPGCGATHAALALLHGQLWAALHANALFVLLLPAGLWFGVECCRRALKSARFQWPAIPARAVYALLICASVFTLVRNLD